MGAMPLLIKVDLAEEWMRCLEEEVMGHSAAGRGRPPQGGPARLRAPPLRPRGGGGSQRRAA